MGLECGYFKDSRLGKSTICQDVAATNGTKVVSKCNLAAMKLEKSTYRMFCLLIEATFFQLKYTFPLFHVFCANYCQAPNKEQYLLHVAKEKLSNATTEWTQQEPRFGAALVHHLL
jgi:hypothetical protein